jgi:hypothetical protein
MLLKTFIFYFYGKTVELILLNNFLTSLDFGAFPADCLLMVFKYYQNINKY